MKMFTRPSEAQPMDPARTNAMCSPFCDQHGYQSVIADGASVSCLGVPPCSGIVHRWKVCLPSAYF